MPYFRNTYTTIRHEDINVISNGRNTYTTIRQEYGTHKGNVIW